MNTNLYSHKYYQIIEYAKLNPPDGYSEVHHIIPKSLGGSDEDDNLVRVSGADHLKLHILLPFFTSGEHKTKMVYAWNMMSNRNGIPIEYDEYQYLREEFSKIASARMTGSKNPNYGIPMTDERKKVFTTLGWKHNEKSKENMRNNRPNKHGKNNPMYGKSHSEETKIFLKECNAGENNPMFGKHHTNESKIATGLGVSKSWENRKKIKCPYCDKESKSSSNMKRWHFDNCKNKKEK